MPITFVIPVGNNDYSFVSPHVKEDILPHTGVNRAVILFQYQAMTDIYDVK